MKKFLATILSVILLLTIIPMAYAKESNTYKAGDIIQFGSYPQSKVTDSATITALNALAPEWDDWSSYGYYTGSGSSGTMKQGDWMRYVDIKYNGERYRGVKFTQYRPYYIYIYSNDYNNHQKDNGYNTNIAYWFKFEPIDWRVLDPSIGLIVSEIVIDAQAYSNTIYSRGDQVYGYYNDASYTNFASDYETSSIREWLNNDFYNIAFTDIEKKEIDITTLNNDGYNTLTGITGYEKLDSNETKDKIFLLSYNDVICSNFGFNSSSSVRDISRSAMGSDYAYSQGLNVNRDISSDYNGNTSWILRSSGAASVRCCNVDTTGRVDDYRDVRSTASGIRPAIRLSTVHEHDYVENITLPTCTEKGYTTYVCECGDTYIDDYIKENGHSFTNYIYDGKATCSTNGLKIAKCDNCDATDSIVISGDHSFSDEWTIDEDPTCKEEGMKSHHCKYCPARKDFTPIGKLAHDFVTVRVEPTCLDEGYTITACKCGEEIIEPIAPTGHDFDGSKCKVCDYDRADDCSCNCHKGGIAGFFWKIINLFNKLFKSKQLCACGAKHW